MRSSIGRHRRGSHAAGMSSSASRRDGRRREASAPALRWSSGTSTASTTGAASASSTGHSVPRPCCRRADRAVAFGRAVLREGGAVSSKGASSASSALRRTGTVVPSSSTGARRCCWCPSDSSGPPCRCSGVSSSRGGDSAGQRWRWGVQKKERWSAGCSERSMRRKRYFKVSARKYESILSSRRCVEVSATDAKPQRTRETFWSAWMTSRPTTR
mmetsp:Transcript_11774/g.47529  ORF Transcript_11774/g.47529 Transcript_11774/m.47529 type:complete len:215 (-) Transcript_11774:196-840(-)